MTSLASWLVASADRVLPLEISRAYRDGPAKRVDVLVVRFASCERCWEAGCPRCAFVGWTVASGSITVDVPAGALPGTRIEVEGAGDVVGGQARPIEFEVVEPGPRADELRFADTDFVTKLETAWSMERAAKARRRRRRRLTAVGGASALFLALIIHSAVSWVTKGGDGAPCTSDEKCRSDFCFGRSCTTPCAATRDCSAGMICLPVGSKGACFPKDE
ncbi:MAG: hypothetical protein KIS78_11160 [Labilithrix sp.]|nr:hypothetical protein [Labilithrix sp.]